MNPYNLTLAPILQLVFSQSGKQSGHEIIQDSRDLFYALIHVSEHVDALPYAYQFVKQQLQTVSDGYAAQFSTKYSQAHLGLLTKKAAATHPHPLPETALKECLAHYAPIFFTELGWLGNITQTVTSQSPLAIDLMAAYLRLIKSHHHIANSREIYHAYLLNAGINLPAVHTVAFAKQPDVSDEIFDFAVLQLALGQFPRVFFPEILGFTLAYCQTLSLPEQFFADDSKKLPDFFAARTEQRKQELAHITAIIKAYINEFSEHTDTIWRRVQCGFWLYQHQLERCDHQLTAHFHAGLSPRQAMEKLITGLLPGAIGNHGKIRLGSRTLDEWFSEKPFKSANFLASLLLSPHVDRAKPENSRLLTLFEFNEPMFGVLDDDSKAIVKDWLLSELNPALLKSRKQQSTQVKVGLKTIANTGKVETAATSAAISETTQNQRINYNSLSNRDLYFYLVNNDLYPEVLLTAKARAERILTIAKWINHLPFRRYSHQAFDKFIESVYQKEKNTYKPLGKKTKLPKEAYVWGIEQFAPTILTDGSWLQGVQQLNYFPNHAIGALLYKIYQDECGNGILEQNHPQIYQALLDSQQIKLPTINSKEFCKHPGFIDSAFDIPIYLMSISKFPNFFLPELLGLNLAIEISGLGNVYLRLSEELKHWGIPSAIVDIHTSIDNLATGHTSLAIHAIKTYLDDITANFGEDAMQAHWRRIHIGYCSLSTASLRFKLSLIKHYKFDRPHEKTNKQAAPTTSQSKTKAQAK